MPGAAASSYRSSRHCSYALGLCLATRCDCAASRTTRSGVNASRGSRIPTGPMPAGGQGRGRGRGLDAAACALLRAGAAVPAAWRRLIASCNAPDSTSKPHSRCASVGAGCSSEDSSRSNTRSALVSEPPPSEATRPPAQAGRGRGASELAVTHLLGEAHELGQLPRWGLARPGVQRSLFTRREQGVFSGEIVHCHGEERVLQAGGKPVL